MIDHSTADPPLLRVDVPATRSRQGDIVQADRKARRHYGQRRYRRLGAIDRTNETVSVYYAQEPR